MSSGYRVPLLVHLRRALGGSISLGLGAGAPPGVGAFGFDFGFRGEGISLDTGTFDAGFLGIAHHLPYRLHISTTQIYCHVLLDTTLLFAFRLVFRRVVLLYILTNSDDILPQRINARL
jgi:hypothetical protein